ncbi:phage portal protein [Kitasatospora sp. GP82]|uniref:phage portal protein n=1 Tax=Kitasatospora sp. GP82 TaxID=3035089 RepID=UPI0024747471|nr:phage portal protein [Kitasatospora sp. GP82]MDH6123435.1 HK97 family phage portal protein [Kitasatospora sp. GP82]
MSLLRRAAQALPDRRFFAPSGAGDPWSIPSNGTLAAYTPAGVPVTEDTALQLLAVSACVRIISGAIANLPLYSVRQQNDIFVRVGKPPLIVSDPFGGQNDIAGITRRVGIRQMMVSLLLRGNAYALVTGWDSRMRPVRLMPLHPDTVRVSRDGTRRVYEVNRQEVPPGAMLHITGMSLPGMDTGLSVISYARNSIGLGLAAEQFGSRFFGDGAHLSGVIEVPGDLDPERARHLKESFTAKHGGIANSHAIGVLSGGAKWAPISVSPEDAQFLGTRAAQNLDIAMTFGVPPHMLGQVDRTTSWGTGIEQQSLGFVRYTLADWFGLLEDAWSAMLPEPQLAQFDVDSLLRTDTAGRFAVYTQARTAGLMTRNEIRAKENMPPVPGGDDISAPLNSSTTTTKADAEDPGAHTAKADAESGKEP